MKKDQTLTKELRQHLDSASSLVDYLEGLIGARNPEVSAETARKILYELGEMRHTMNVLRARFDDRVSFTAKRDRASVVNP